MPVDYKQIGAHIKQKRYQKGWTQENLAEKIDVTVGYVSQLERGVTKINLDTLSEISGVLECEISYFISGTAPATSEYLTEDFCKAFLNLNDTNRRMVLDIIEVIRKNG